MQHLLGRLRAGWYASGLWSVEAISPYDAGEVEAIEDELKLLFESGDLSPDAQQRGKELGADRARLKASLTQVPAGTG